MKRFLALLAALAATVPMAWAVCPVCTVAVGAGVGLLRTFGVDDVISGLWIGALIVSSIAWTLDFLRKRKIHFLFKKPIIVLGMYAAFIIPLWWGGLIGQSGNVTWGIDKILLGAIFGSVIFILAILADHYLRHNNGNKVLVPYQRVFVPVIFLIIASLVTHYLLVLF